MNIIKTALFLFFLFLSASMLNAQGMAFGVKGGVGLGTQKWDISEKSPLFIYSGIAFMQSNNEYNNNNFYGQVGYHTRGSAIISPGFTDTNTGTTYPRRSTKFVFKNLELTLGFKQTRPINDDMTFYYMVGLRGEYNISTNLDEFEELNKYARNYYPIEAGVKKILYGFTIQGGLEFMFSELVGGNIEFSFYPDVSNQYFTPPIDNVIDPYRPGQTISLRERKIKNLSFEVTVGFTFLRKVEYYED